MDIEKLRDYCLSKKMVEECLPFDNETLVFKVAGKMFLLYSLTPPFTMNVKADPEKVIELRENYEEVRPGYHMNKKHWITVDLEGRLSDVLIMKWIDDSYDLVVAGLSRKLKSELYEN